MPDEGNEDELQSEHRHASHQTANRGKAVTLELFFDLVFDWCGHVRHFVLAGETDPRRHVRRSLT
jgi:hypothetical protein